MTNPRAREDTEKRDALLQLLAYEVQSAAAEFAREYSKSMQQKAKGEPMAEMAEGMGPRWKFLANVMIPSTVRDSLAKAYDAGFRHGQKWPKQ